MLICECGKDLKPEVRVDEMARNRGGATFPFSNLELRSLKATRRRFPSGRFYIVIYRLRPFMEKPKMRPQMPPTMWVS